MSCTQTPIHPPRTVALAGAWLVRGLVAWVLLAAGILWSAPGFAASITLTDSETSVALWPVVRVAPDPKGQHTLQDVLAMPDAFVAPPGTPGTLGLRKGAMWLRMPFSVAASSDGDWTLDVDYPVLHRIDIYLLWQGQVIQETVLGSLQPFAQRPLLSRSHALPLQVQPGQSYELVLRVQTLGAMVLPMTLNKPAALNSRALTEQMIQGLLNGLALCLLLYSLAQWVSLREVLFLQYALMVSGSLLFSVHFFGIGAQYLWRDNPWFESHAAGLAALIATCGSFLFISQALVGHLPQGRLLRWMRGGALLCVALAALYLLDGFSTAAIAAVVTVLGLVPALMGIPGAIRRARDGDAVGTSLLLAWLVYLVATATVIGVIRGWAPVNFWTLHSFQLGATLDMLLFMQVLGLRTKALRRQAQDAHRERDAMHSLAHSDPLTDLPNRRGLHQALESALTRCSPHQLLAVYVLDLDGFKPVNDQYGHDTGDELLVAAAGRLQGHMRQADLVARLGGDEFVVVAANLATPEQAHALGTKLLEAFRAPFSLREAEVQVGLTVGYAIAPLDGNDPVTLLKQADAAMYNGKQSGKFCVRRSAGGHLPTAGV